MLLYQLAMNTYKRRLFMAEIKNSIWIDEDIDKVFRITNNIGEWKNLFSEYEESEILEQDGNWYRFRLTTKKDEQQNSYSWISERIVDYENHISNAKRKSPMYPFKSMVIKWTYKSCDLGTLMTWIQCFEVDDTCPISEKEFINNLNKGTREQMSIIREKIERGKIQ